MRRTTRLPWKPALAACVIALLVLPAAASAGMEYFDGPVGYYADLPQTPLRHENAPQPRVSSAVTEVRTVKVGGSDNTLPLALSAAALGIALGGVAYVTFRLSPRMVRARRQTEILRAPR